MLRIQIKFGIADRLYLQLRAFGSINLPCDLVDVNVLGNKYVNLGFLAICTAHFLVITCLRSLSEIRFSFSIFCLYVKSTFGKIRLTDSFCTDSNILQDLTDIELFHTGAANSRIDLMKSMYTSTNVLVFDPKYFRHLKK